MIINLKLDDNAIFYFQTTYTFDKIVLIIFYISLNLLKWKSLTWIVNIVTFKSILNLMNCILCLQQFVMIWICWIRILKCFVLFITITFITLQYQFHILPNHLLGNSKMQLVTSSFLPFKFGNKGLYTSKKM